MPKNDYSEEFFAIKKLLNNVNWKEISKRLNVTQASFSNYATGKSRCPFTVARAFAAVYDIDWKLVCKRQRHKTETDPDQINISFNTFK